MELSKHQSCAGNQTATLNPDAIKCPLCKDILQNPSISDCGHIACLKCWEDWEKQKRNYCLTCLKPNVTFKIFPFANSLLDHACIICEFEGCCEIILASHKGEHESNCTWNPWLEHHHQCIPCNKSSLTKFEWETQHKKCAELAEKRKIIAQIKISVEEWKATDRRNAQLRPIVQKHLVILNKKYDKRLREIQSTNQKLKNRLMDLKRKNLDLTRGLDSLNQKLYKELGYFTDEEADHMVFFINLGPLILEKEDWLSVKSLTTSGKKFILQMLQRLQCPASLIKVLQMEGGFDWTAGLNDIVFDKDLSKPKKLVLRKIHYDTNSKVRLGIAPEFMNRHLPGVIKKPGSLFIFKN